MHQHISLHSRINYLRLTVCPVRLLDPPVVGDVLPLGVDAVEGEPAQVGDGVVLVLTDDALRLLQVAGLGGGLPPVNQVA